MTFGRWFLSEFFKGFDSETAVPFLLIFIFIVALLLIFSTGLLFRIVLASLLMLVVMAIFVGVWFVYKSARTEYDIKFGKKETDK